jgi:hypothetical protein
MPNVSEIRSDRETIASSSNFSSSASFTDSQLTASSSTTVWGPGAIAGKGLLAFGKSALRGVEYFVIHRRLAKIRLRFPHTDDDAADEHLDKMYNEILELSRYGLVLHCKIR